MPRKRKPHRDEILTRTATISSFQMYVWSHATEPRGSEPEIETSCSLQLVGLLDEPVRDVRQIEIHLRPEDEVRVGAVRPAAVGAIIDFRPQLLAVVSFVHRDFDRLWSMALTGNLKYAGLTFTKPRYNRALVTSVSFSTEQEE